MTEVTYVTEQDFKDEVLSSSLPVLWISQLFGVVLARWLTRSSSSWLATGMGKSKSSNVMLTRTQTS